MRNTRIHGPYAVFVLALVLAGTTAPAQIAVLYNFGSKAGDPLQPSYSGIVAQGRDGNLYSTSVSGGTGTGGTVFRIAPNGRLKVLYNFDSTHGATPYGGLTLGSDGRFYGTATTAGQGCCGTIYKITPSGALTVIHNFTGGADGGAPQAPPIQGRDGKFYGTTNGGVGAPFGTIYKITASGQFKTLYTFDVTHGAFPTAPLIQGTDGNFYGVTINGGSGSSFGEVFKMSPAGNLKVLFPFDGLHGVSPTGPLIQAKDGNFYGTTYGGGANNFGTVFKMALNGTVTVLHSFNFNPDGGRPTAGLVEVGAGTFYGSTSDGGTLGFGTIFTIDSGGNFHVIYTFDQTTGAYPLVTLALHTNGTLYSDTQKGGTGPNNCGAGVCSGVFYSLGTALDPFVTLLPKSGQAGKTIGILGQGFKGTSAVSFGGIPAPYKVVSDTYLIATVPIGAGGLVTVSTPGGVLSSKSEFVVAP